MATNLTTENIKTISQFPELPAADIASDDVILVQDVSENAYKKTFLQAILNWIDKGINQKAFDIAHPVGETYVQFPSIPDMDGVQRNTVDPMTLYNVNGITSTWVELNFDGAFFRANGGLSETFDGGKQNEELPNITGTVHGNRLRTSNSQSGCFISPTSNSGENCATNDLKNVNYNIVFDASKTTGTGYGVYKNNGHVTPENYTIRVWLRTA